MLNLGLVRPGSTIYVPFDTFGASGESLTMSGLAVTDIEVYKNGSVTQRSSDSGYTLLDTDGIDFDGITGVHGFSIDLSDNTDSGFWVAGADYRVVVSAITVNSQTVSFTAARFRIGYEGALYNTTIATLASQTSFTLTAGPAEDDALNGCVVAIHDIASGVQMGFAVVSDYTGSTKTVTLTAGVTFTAAAGDNISIFPPANARWLGATAQTARDLGASVLLSPGTGTGQVSLSSGAVTVGTNNDKTGYGLSSAAVQAIWDALTSALTTVGSIGKLLVDRIDAAISSRSSHSAADAADAVWDEALSGHLGSGSTGEALNAAGASGDPWTTALPGAYGAGSAGYIVGNNLDAAVSSRSSHDAAAVVTAIGNGSTLTEAGGTGDHLTAVPWNASWDAEVQSEVADALDAAVPGTPTSGSINERIKTMDDAYTATRAGYLDNLSAGAVATASALSTVATNVSTILGKWTGITLLANWLRLLARKDAAIATDAATELAEINANGGSGAGAFANTTDAQEALRDNQLSAAQVNAEMVDVLATDTYAESSAVPAASASLATKIRWLATLARNKITQTATTKTVYADDGSTPVATATVADDGTTFSHGEMT